MNTLGFIVATSDISGLATVDVDVDGLHNSALCSSKSMTPVEFLEDDIRRAISSPMMAVEINIGNTSTHPFFCVNSNPCI